MPRTLVALVAATALAVPLAACSGSDSDATPTSTKAETGAAPATIVLRGRQGSEGQWQRSLRLELVRSDITNFTVCAVMNRSSPPESCRAAAGEPLARGSTLRLEQRRGAGDWTVVGTSRDNALEAVLSNAVAGNRPGAVSYRVTLRNSGRVLGTSNPFGVYWVP